MTVALIDGQIVDVNKEFERLLKNSKSNFQNCKCVNSKNNIILFSIFMVSLTLYSLYFFFVCIGFKQQYPFSQLLIQVFVPRHIPW